MGHKSTECRDEIWKERDLGRGDWMMASPPSRQDDDQFRYDRGGGGGIYCGNSRGVEEIARVNSLMFTLMIHG